MNSFVFTPKKTQLYLLDGNYLQVSNRLTSEHYTRLMFTNYTIVHLYR